MTDNCECGSPTLFTRRAAAVRQSAALAAEVERLNLIISRLYAEGQDAVEM